MAPLRQWSLRRAGWAHAGGWFVCTAGLVSLLYLPLSFVDIHRLAFYWLGCAVVAAALLATAWIRHSRPEQGTLSLLDSGLWGISRPNASNEWQLAHAWPARAWITLHFVPRDTSDGRRSTKVTVWRSCVSASAWRELCIHVAGQAVQPGLVSSRGIS